MLESFRQTLNFPRKADNASSHCTNWDFFLRSSEFEEPMAQAISEKEDIKWDFGE